MSPSSGLVALGLAATAISLGVIAAKQAFADGAEPQDLLAARLLIAAPLLMLVLPWTIRTIRRPVGAGPLAMVVLGGATIWLGNRAEFEGLARLPAGMLVVLLATLPVWVALTAWIVWGRVPSIMIRFAVVAVVGGVAIMAVPFGSSLDPLGVLAGLGAAICITAFLFLLERNERVSAVVGFQLAMIGAAILLLALNPGSIGNLVSDGPELPLIAAVGVSAAVWALLVGLGLGATDSVTAAIMVAVEPLLVAILAFVILGEGLSAREIAGGIVVLAAVVAVAIQVRREGGGAGAPVPSGDSAR